MYTAHINWHIVMLVLAALTIVACVQQPMAAGPIAGNNSAAASERLDELVGAWQVQTSVEQQNLNFPTLLTFTSDGIVFGDEPPSPFETTAHGNWAPTSSGSAAFTFMALIGSEEGSLSARLKVVGSLNYKSQADTWHGLFQIEVADAEGNNILVDRGTLDASRIEIEPLAVAVFDAFNAAVNTHDVDAALDFFADDAVARFPSQPSPNIYSGKTEIRNWLSADAAQNIHVETSNVRANKDRVTAIGKVDVDMLRSQGMSLEGTVEVNVKEGKITTFSYTLSEETLESQMALTVDQPIIAIFDPGGETAEEYDQIIRELEMAGAGSPSGRWYHMGYMRDEVVVVADVWESGVLLEQFAQTLVPIVQDMAVTPTEPRVFSVHNIIVGSRSIDRASEAYQPIMAVFDPAAKSAEQYDQITSHLEAAGAGNPKGRLYHVAYPNDGTVTVADIWESADLLGQFAQTLIPVLHELGITPVDPTIYPVHNLIDGQREVESASP